ncbi:MAG: tRNA (N6-threonylcarbamoyladenosine(37)-N6)-methyltransferase TrmO [Promethearchaeota archaeon]|nr:MAG: tRNA (N6-threonylcarbamoyladenosine(37)-N6)-methyltransferase TrmO [Candidatus Lokiarchaeota archaeon]
MSEKMKEYRICPVGKVKVLSDESVRVRNKNSIVSEIIIEEEFQECLDGIEGFSHVLIFFWPHHLSEEQRKTKKVHPRGKSTNPLTGVFATRSQARPNPILISAVKLLDKEKDRIKIKGLDAYDNTPIIDIKPYVPYFDSPMKVKMPTWIGDLDYLYKHSDENSD